MKMEIRSRSQAARERGDTGHSNSRGAASGDSTKGRISRAWIRASKGESRCRHDAVDPEANRIENPWTKGMCFTHRKKLPPRIVSRQLVVQLVGLSHGSAVEHV